MGRKRKTTNTTVPDVVDLNRDCNVVMLLDDDEEGGEEEEEEEQDAQQVAEEELLALTLSCHPFNKGKAPMVSSSPSPQKRLSRFEVGILADDDDPSLRLQLRPPSPPGLRLAPPSPPAEEESREAEESPPPSQAVDWPLMIQQQHHQLMLQHRPYLQHHQPLLAAPLAIAPPPHHAFAHPSPPIFRAPFRPRRNPSQALGEGKTDNIPPPYPWSTDRRGVVHTLETLLSMGITRIPGEVQCKRCEAEAVMEYDLVSKFYEVASFIVSRRGQMSDRAPAEWMNPAFPECKSCQQPNCMRPVVAAKKRAINWLFMLLGQTLGCCTLEQLKYFCKHTKKHRTGSKEHVLYTAFLGICHQLDPSGTFEHRA